MTSEAGDELGFFTITITRKYKAFTIQIIQIWLLVFLGWTSFFISRAVRCVRCVRCLRACANRSHLCTRTRACIISPRSRAPLHFARRYRLAWR